MSPRAHAPERTAPRPHARAGAVSAPPPRRRASDGVERSRGRIVIDPRHRRHVLLWSLAVVGLLLALAAAAAVSPLLDVEDVEVTGVTPERAAAVRRASGIDEGDSIVTWLPSQVADRVRALPWVADVSVTRDLPATVHIEVVPREPVGWVRAGDEVLVVDGSGRVLWRVEGPPGAIPELSGAADVAPPGGIVRPVALARVAEGLGPTLRARTVAVVLADGSASAQVADGPQLRFGAPRNVAVKARVAAAILASLGDQPTTYVDVSVPAAPVSG